MLQPPPVPRTRFHALAFPAAFRTLPRPAPRSLQRPLRKCSVAGLWTARWSPQSPPARRPLLRAGPCRTAWPTAERAPPASPEQLQPGGGRAGGPPHRPDSRPLASVLPRTRPPESPGAAAARSRQPLRHRHHHLSRPPCWGSERGTAPRTRGVARGSRLAGSQTAGHPPHPTPRSVCAAFSRRCHWLLLSRLARQKPSSADSLAACG